MFCPYCTTQITEILDVCPVCKSEVRDCLEEQKVMEIKNHLIHTDNYLSGLNHKYAIWGIVMYGGLLPTIICGFFLCTQNANDADFSFLIGVSLIVFLLSFPVYIFGFIIRGIKGRRIRKILDKKYEQYINEK